MTHPMPPRKRLDSWKQIADHLGCCERTAKRYESRGLPVYRIGGQQQPHQRVFAYADELDHWRHEGGAALAQEDQREADSSNEAIAHIVAPARRPGASRLRLDITEGPDSGAGFLVSGSSTIIGRDIGAGVVLADPRISRRHARIDRQGEAFFLEDLKSRNGTALNAKNLAERTPLHHGDQIRLGEAITLRVTLVYASATVDSSAK